MTQLLPKRKSGWDRSELQWGLREGANLEHQTDTKVRKKLNPKNLWKYLSAIKGWWVKRTTGARSESETGVKNRLWAAVLGDASLSSRWPTWPQPTPPAPNWPALSTLASNFHTPTPLLGKNLILWEPTRISFYLLASCLAACILCILGNSELSSSEELLIVLQHPMALYASLPAPAFGWKCIPTKSPPYLFSLISLRLTDSSVHHSTELQAILKSMRMFKNLCVGCLNSRLNHGRSIFSCWAFRRFRKRRGGGR